MSTKLAANSLEVTGSFLEIQDVLKEKHLPKLPKPLTETPPLKKTSLPLVVKTSSTVRSLSQPKLNVNVNHSHRNCMSRVSNPNSRLEIKAPLLNNRQDDLKRLKARIIELEKHGSKLKKAQEEHGRLIEELGIDYEIRNQQVKRLEENNRNLASENQELHKKLLLNQELKDSNLRFQDEMTRLNKKHEDEMNELKSMHEKEMQLKEDKLQLLKNQIAEGIKSNSWERHLQIEELTKELKRSQDECEMVKYKLKSLKINNQDSCQNCNKMSETLNKQSTQFSHYEKLVQCLLESIKKCGSSTSHSGIKDELNKLFTSSNSSNAILSKLNIIEFIGDSKKSSLSNDPTKKSTFISKTPQQKK